MIRTRSGQTPRPLSNTAVTLPRSTPVVDGRARCPLRVSTGAAAMRTGVTRKLGHQPVRGLASSTRAQSAPAGAERRSLFLSRAPLGAPTQAASRVTGPPRWSGVPPYHQGPRLPRLLTFTLLVVVLSLCKGQAGVNAFVCGRHIWKCPVSRWLVLMRTQHQQIDGVSF